MHLRADGGEPAVTSSPPDPDEWFLTDRPVLLDLNAFRRDLFVTTALYGDGGDRDSRPNGLEIKQAIERLCGRTVYVGQLYPAFHDLIDADLLRTDPRHQDVNHYVVTERGQAALCAYARLLRAATRAAGGPDPARASSSHTGAGADRPDQAGTRDTPRDHCGDRGGGR